MLKAAFRRLAHLERMALAHGKGERRIWGLTNCREGDGGGRGHGNPKFCLDTASVGCPVVTLAGLERSEGKAWGRTGTAARAGPEHYGLGPERARQEKGALRGQSWGAVASGASRPSGACTRWQRGWERPCPTNAKQPVAKCVESHKDRADPGFTDLEVTGSRHRKS